jgi:hypothetical protein
VETERDLVIEVASDPRMAQRLLGGIAFTRVYLRNA